MKDRLFGHYHKIRYWLRIKYWRGRNVHSPFMYNLVREAMLKRKERDFPIDTGLLEFLTEKKVQRTHAELICRIYNRLRLSGYACGTDARNGVDLFMIPEDSSADRCRDLIGHLRQTLQPSECKCVVFLGLYRSRRQRQLWKSVIDESDAVAVDFYHLGCLFFNKKVKKQFYKMKL